MIIINTNSSLNKQDQIAILDAFKEAESDSLIFLVSDVKLLKKSAATLQKLYNTQGIRTYMITEQEEQAIEKELDKLPEEANELDEYLAITNAVKEPMADTRLLITLDPAYEAKRTIVPQQQQTKGAEQTMEVYTKAELDAIVKEATKRTADMMAKKVIAAQEETEKYKEALVQATFGEQAPTPEPVTEDIRREFYMQVREQELKAKALRGQQFDAARVGNKALVDKYEEEIKMHMANAKALRDELSMREKAAGAVYRTAEATRTHGHKAIDIVANVAHATVDLVAKGMDMTGNFIAGKPQQKSLITEVPAKPSESVEVKIPVFNLQ